MILIDRINKLMPERIKEGIKAKGSDVSSFKLNRKESCNEKY